MTRHRDIFPLPRGTAKSYGDLNKEGSGSIRPGHAACQNSPVSRCVARRRQVLTHTASVSEDSVQALNSLHGECDSPCSASKISAAQQKALNNLRQSAKSLGRPPVDLPAKGALSELIGDCCYGGESSTVAPLDIDRLALTPSGFRPVPLEESDARLGLDSVSWIRSKLLPTGESAEKRKCSGVRRVYSDPSLQRSHRLYVRYAKLLHDRRIIRYGRAPEVRVGSFVVEIGR